MKSRLTADGRLSIGTTYAGAKLTVVGNENTNIAYGVRRYFRHNSGLQTDSSSWGHATIYASDAIVSGSYIASVAGALGGSDERIKK